MIWASKKTDHLTRGDQRTVVKFAWLPTVLGYGTSEDPTHNRIGQTVWLRTYESCQVWFDSYFNSNYRWREVSRLPAGFEVPKSPEYKSLKMLFADVRPPP